MRAVWLLLIASLGFLLLGLLLREIATGRSVRYAGVVWWALCLSVLGFGLWRGEFWAVLAALLMVLSWWGSKLKD